MKKESQTFSESFKCSIVDQVNRGLIGKEEARRRYSIKGKSSILQWQRNYQKYGRCSLNLIVDTIPLKTKKPSAAVLDSPEALHARIKQLERQLEDEQIRSEAYSRMIDFAEKELNVPIRKKPGTR
jgi:transposase-like protein